MQIDSKGRLYVDVPDTHVDGFLYSTLFGSRSPLDALKQRHHRGAHTHQSINYRAHDPTAHTSKGWLPPRPNQTAKTNGREKRRQISRSHAKWRTQRITLHDDGPSKKISMSPSGRLSPASVSVSPSVQSSSPRKIARVPATSYTESLRRRVRVKN